MSFSNQQVAQIFRDIATAMEVLGEQSFKTQAYARAADTIAALPVSLQHYLEQGNLNELPGVGPAISAKITELLTTGTMAFRERLREQVPDGVIEIVRIPGVGPKTALRFYREFGIDSVAVLVAAAREGRLRTLKGVGAKAETRILQALEARTDADSRSLLGEMLPLARDLAAVLRTTIPEVIEAGYAGSIRRAAPVVGDIDLVAAADDPQQVIDAFGALPHVAQIVASGPGRADALLHNGKSCSLLVVLPQQWGAALALRTGSAAHRDRLATLAAERGLSFHDDALWRDGDLIPTPTEVVFYGALGLPFISPELREDWGEIEAAQTGRLPQLIEPGDLRADLHTHSVWSDGHHTIAQMAEAAITLGYSYYVVTDHSLYMGMVNGLDGVRLRQQRQEIDALNLQFEQRGLDFRLLQGIEVDILPDGALALPDDVLAELDWVVASPHVSLHQPRQAATDRLLRAIHNPHVDCIGHPTGRLLLRRQGSDLDMRAILEAAAETGTLLELDGAYQRLDLDAEHIQRAIELGVKIAIDSDAHAANELINIEYGVLTARRGWATAMDVVNCKASLIKKS